MTNPAKARFNALIWCQAVGVVMVVTGMLPYWFGVGGAQVPATVNWNIGFILAIGFLMVIVPLVWNNFGGQLEELAGGDRKSQPIADNPRRVKWLTWIYCYVNLILVNYLVHTTGGIAGSMFAGIYLLIPAVGLLLTADLADLGKVMMLIGASALGILLAFLMSRFGVVAYDPTQHKHAFDISMSSVALEGTCVPFVQALILRLQMRRNKNSATGEWPASSPTA